jgi:uncharacterized protein YciI
MLFAVINTDRPGALDLRLSTRPTHLAFLEGEAGKIVTGGAMLDASGQPAGSLLVVDVEDRAAAEAFAAADPYARAGLFESSVVRPFRQVFKDGAKLA